MNYSVEFLTDFVDKLTALDNEYKSAAAQHNERLGSIFAGAGSSRKNGISAALSAGMKLSSDAKAAVSGLLASQDSVAQDFLKKHESDFAMLSSCSKLLAIISNVESNFTSPQEYERFCKAKKHEYNLTPQMIIADEAHLLEMIYNANLALMGTSSAEKKKKCSMLYCYCTAAQSVLEEQILSIRRSIFADKANAVETCTNARSKTDERLADYIGAANRFFEDSCNKLSKHFFELNDWKNEAIKQANQALKSRLEELKEQFLREFPVLELSAEYDRIYRSEPNYSDYHCTDDIPRTICIGKFEHDISNSGYSDYTLAILDSFYSFMYDGKRLIIPQCVAFDGAVNYLFRYDGNASDTIRTLASGIAMRMFMMTQLGKLKFTFYDPVALGSTFIDFSGLVNIDDRSAELINGKIWTSSEDIEDRLHRLAEHISGVTQRCLRGQFSNIYEYNKDAGYNAEPYQIIVIMDYPASLSDNALRLIEQIAQSGSKCGVFILLFGSTNQRRQLKDYSVTLADSLESYFPAMMFDSAENAFSAVLRERNYRFEWQPSETVPDEHKERIFETLRAGIKSMEKVVIGIDRVQNAEVSDSTENGIRVPIGISGVNAVQYLTFGSGSCHHALIAGIAGMGKSSLLHTIIMQCLKQYSPEELNIYLVDFKRGVEFKVYADYRIPQFKVISVESEREFGYNVLKAIDREQKVRADIFKNFSGAGRIERINELRKNGGKMPRILVIMDEFHELFTEDDEISRQSAVLMERIVRQGRAFGIHLILSSQSYANVKGLEKAVYDQMAVRMVMKCSAEDANMLLENGSGMVDLISAEDAGKVIYNSESGSKAACSMFRAAYIRPEQHREMLAQICEKYAAYPDGNTRILLSSVEDNVFSKFNRFAQADYVDDNRQLIVGESLDMTGVMNISFSRSQRSNLLMVGDNTDKARNLFCFAIISFCIDCWLKNGKRPPEKPVISLFNFKPLNDDYFVDTPAVAAGLLNKYVDYVDCSSAEAVNARITELYSACRSENETDSYLAIFGYQRAEALRSAVKLNVGGQSISAHEMFGEILKNGSEHGVHTIMWQDRLNSISENPAETVSLFNMRIAFEMSRESLMSFIMEDSDTIDESSAIYFNSMYDNRKFRVYQTPHIEWIKNICETLNGSKQ
ncbi:MAG: FtsK/SpoIIIE domain-containing protein [Oscillospiraceae bacterium]